MSAVNPGDGGASNGGTGDGSGREVGAPVGDDAGSGAFRPQATDRDESLGGEARKVLSGVVATYAAMAASMAANVIAVPLYLHHLGKINYGLWITATSTNAYLGLIGLGINQTVGNMFGAAHARGDVHEASTVLATGFWKAVRHSLVALPVTVLLALALPTSSLFKATGVSDANVRLILFVSWVGFLTEFPFGIFGVCLRTAGMIAKFQVFSVLQTVARLAAAIAVLRLNGSVLALIAALAAVNVGAGVLQATALGRAAPGVRPWPRLSDRAVARRMIRPGIYFLMLQTGGAVMFSSDVLVISATLGASSVTAFSIAQRLTGMAQSLAVTFSANYAPLFLKAYARRDRSSLEAQYRRAVVTSASLALVACLGLAIAGPSVIRVWVGPDSFVGRFPFSMMIAALAVQVALSPADVLLMATARHRVYAVAILWEAALNLALSIFLARRLGVGGVVLGTILARFLGAGPVMVLMARKVVRGR